MKPKFRKTWIRIDNAAFQAYPDVEVDPEDDMPTRPVRYLLGALGEGVTSPSHYGSKLVSASSPSPGHIRCIRNGDGSVEYLHRDDFERWLGGMLAEDAERRLRGSD